MENIQFDICNGLENLVISNTKTKPSIIQGMGVVLLLNGLEVHVEIESIGKDGSICFGKVLEIGRSANTIQELCIGDTVKFQRENINYPLSKEKSIL